MPSSGLEGPFPLTTIGVDSAVKYASPGAYALGQTDNAGTFHVHYVGRADDDVAGRLQQHVPRWYPQFKYGYFQTAKAAFDKECALYHDFNPPDNQIHPAKPANTNCKCPVCGA
jgi:hypothetical protein